MMSWIVVSMFYAVLPLALGMLIHNDRVYRFRMKWIARDLDIYCRMPSYNYMWLHFWVPFSRYEKEAQQ